MKLMQRLRTIFRRRVLVLPEPPPPAPTRWKPSPRIVTRAYDTARSRAPLPRRTQASEPAPQLASSGDPLTDLLLLQTMLDSQPSVSTATTAVPDLSIDAGGGSFGGGGASSDWSSSYDISSSTSATSDSYSTSDSLSSDSSSSSGSDF